MEPEHHKFDQLDPPDEIPDAIKPVLKLLLDDYLLVLT